VGDPEVPGEAVEVGEVVTVASSFAAANAQTMPTSRTTATTDATATAILRLFVRTTITASNVDQQRLSYHGDDEPS
jgi:hypothetical protein